MKTNASGNRSGMTVVELLAVLSVMGFCAVILPAAVQQSREQARQKQCQDRLHSFGVALHNYHDVYHIYPMGWMEPQQQSLVAPLEADSLGGWGFQARLLPFVKQVEWFNELDLNLPLPTKEPFGKGLRRSLGLFRCPADRMDMINPIRMEHMTSNYSGCSGNQAISSWGPGVFTRNWPGGEFIPEKTNGIFWWNTSTGISSISDGTANTYMVGERSVTSAAGIWAGVTSNRNFNDQVTDCSPGNEINSGIGAFSSLHEGGANFLIADGSVRFVNQKIDSAEGDAMTMGVYQKLASIAGREELTQGVKKP